MTPKEQFLILVNNDCISKSDAIILLEGDGFNRYKKAIQLYKEGLSDLLVFSGGIVNYEYGSIPYSEIYPLLIDEGIPEYAIVHEKKSQNTREQAIEIIKLAKNKNWKKLLLVASHYHQYRAYLTFLKVIFDSQSEIILYNAPVTNLKWFEETNWGKRFELLEQEFQRIDNYSRKGHLATYYEAIKYQKWKEKQV